VSDSAGISDEVDVVLSRDAAVEEDVPVVPCDDPPPDSVE
jgi:hypothetical protein